MDQDKPKDLKAALGGKKPLFALCAPAPLNYWARAHQWGNYKYTVVGNYLRPPNDMTDLERALEYISATQRHLTDVAHKIVNFLAQGRGASVNAIQAVYCKDEESGLPQLAHAEASLGICIQQLVDAGLLPEDPGTPWQITTKIDDEPEFKFDSILSQDYCKKCNDYEKTIEEPVADSVLREFDNRGMYKNNLIPGPYNPQITNSK